MYIVKTFFTDLQDNDHPYEPGDVYPREGLDPSPERIAELAGTNNRRGEPLITAVKAEAKKAPAKKPAAKKAVKVSAGK